MALCMGCMREIGDNVICPSCRFDNSNEQHSPFLPYGTVLHGRYIVGSVIDTNGESSRYIAFDKQTGDVVIVCEFLPMGLFERENDETNLTVRFENDEVFRKLTQDFISYFRTIAELKDFSALIRIHNIFQENNTAYVIEENQDLIPFEEYVERSNGSLEWDIARPLFMPVISALEALHRRGLGHYAISPKNMYVTAYGKIKIAGFATSNERKRGTPLKSQLYSGCAAPEQYENNFPLDTITEIYGFSATLFYALTGHLPAPAKDRLKDSRLLMSTSTVKRLPPHVVTAIANGLQVKRENRITDFDALRSQLSVSHTAQAIQEEISRTANMNMKKSDIKKAKGPRRSGQDRRFPIMSAKPTRKPKPTRSTTTTSPFTVIPRRFTPTITPRALSPSSIPLRARRLPLRVSIRFPSRSARARRCVSSPTWITRALTQPQRRLRTRASLLMPSISTALRLTRAM